LTGFNFTPAQVFVALGTTLLALAIALRVTRSAAVTATS
jgi:hypothetical protein